MATDYDKMRDDIIDTYNNPHVEVDPEINEVQRKFGLAYAELMISTLRAMDEDQAHPVPLTITIVMAAVGPMINMLANVNDPLMREHLRELAIEQFNKAMAPDAELLGEDRKVPEKVTH